MTHAEFHLAVRTIAGGRYFSTLVEVTDNVEGTPGPQVRWKAYTSASGWTADCVTPDEALRELGSKVGEASLDSLGDVASEVAR